MRFNAMEESYEEVTVLGQQALFTDIRIDRNSVPEGLYLYEVRHDDNGRGDPVQIAKAILVNHWGTLITKKPFELPSDGYLDIDPETDWAYCTGECRTVTEYMAESPPKRNKDYER